MKIVNVCLSILVDWDLIDKISGIVCVAFWYGIACYSGQWFGLDFNCFGKFRINQPETFLTVMLYRPGQ